MRMPASARISLRWLHSGRRKSGSPAGARVSRSVLSRNPVVSATSDHECPEPTARTVAPAASASRTIAATCSIVSGA